MPIRADLRKFYGRAWRTVIRPRILARAGNRCEQCGVPNYVAVLRGPAGCWLKTKPMERSVWHTCTGATFEYLEGSIRMVHIVLTIAHLNHVAGDDRDENLKALCQWCHLNYDKLHHKDTRAARKDAARPLLQLIESSRREAS